MIQSRPVTPDSADDARQHIDARNLQEGFAAVEQFSKRTAELSDRIRTGIQGFERRLSSLEGKVKAEVVFDKDDGTFLSFEQMNLEWRLMWSRKSNGGQLQDQRPLTKTDIEVQNRAISRLPELLSAMVEAHRQRVAELEPAAQAMEQMGIDAVGLYQDEAA